MMIKNYSKHLSFVHLVFTIMSPNGLNNQLMRHARCICTVLQYKLNVFVSTQYRGR